MSNLGLPAVLLLIASLPVPSLSGPGSPPDELYELATRLRQEEGPEAAKALADFLLTQRDSETRAQAALALGWDDYRKEDWERAAGWFELATHSRLFADWAVLHRAEALARMERWQETIRVLKAGDFQGSSLAERALVLLGEVLVRSGQAQSAVALLEDEGPSEDRPAVLLIRAQALEATGQPERAVPLLQKIYFSFPLSPQAESAKGRLNELRKRLAEGAAADTAGLWRTRAERLWSEQAFVGASDAFRQLAARLEGSAAQQARLQAALADYYRGQRDDACHVAGEVPPVEGGPEAERLALLARCAMRRGRWLQANQFLQSLEASHRSAPAHERALLAGATTAWLRGESERALEFYRRHLAAFGDSRAAVVSHWRLTWAAVGGEAAENSPTMLEDHIRRFPDSPFRARALYWRARMEPGGTRNEKAADWLKILQRVAPWDYLTEQSLDLTADPGRSPGAEGSGKTEGRAASGVRRDGDEGGALSREQRSLREKTEVLRRLGLWEWAGELLDGALRREPHAELWMERARVAQARQDYSWAAEYARRAYPDYLMSSLNDIPREAWEILFPRPYLEWIRRESARRRVDPYLVLALMRQESRFDKSAVSSAGALGLMQLMLPTARDLARNRRLPRNEVLDPETNVTLGVEYVAYLLRRFDGSREKALAAYNGGATRVNDWARGAEGDPPKFVENIPLEQTREFVYIVWRNYRLYRALYAPAE